ncbi:pyruvate ferredoxin oxidoreductase, partial [Candidatus Kuenenbacteria bacterium]|nr:pyruvate ferredoxin oxidoreductase [Candidatus Kuenenbacteria bacterium]
MTYKMPFNHLLNPGHSACAGCGEILAMRHVLQSAGKNTIVTNATGCSEVTTSRYPMCAFKTPWIHANFENAAPVASGVLAALKHIRDSRHSHEDSQHSHQTNVLAWGGDGATFDIGMGMLSGTWERGENILYVCFDNEAYMNTGIQASGSTPFDANTTTSPPGKESTGNQLQKKDMLKIALAHKCSYVATATVGNLIDIDNKVKKALKIPGPKYLQILVTCVPGWHTDAKDTIKVAKLAQ